MKEDAQEIKKINIRDSQNFLCDTNLVKKIIDISSINNNDLVIEIGPGRGIITEQLALKAKKVVGIEFDQELYLDLLNKFKMNSNISIKNADFLNYSLPENENYKIFSNIPFNLTSKILNKILGFSNPPQDMYLIMQYEAFLNYVGEPLNKENYKSLLYKPKFEIKEVYKFNKEDFYPVPSVDIILVNFKIRPFCDIKKCPIIDYWDFVSYIYMSPGNNLEQKTKKILTYEQLKRSKKYIGIDLQSNISSWTYQGWLKLFDVYLQFVSQEKKNLVKGSYQKMSNENNKLDKIYRTRLDEDWRNKYGRD